ncbi:hypothetical protein EB001_22695, partial [bacterium]|nr:hypothetical protein [bacterium]
MKKIVFTSGLPRSGSTLLSAILNQNPRFRANVSVPIRQIFDMIIDITSSPGNNQKCFDENLDDILRSILDTFHQGDCVHFNHNRFWTSRTELLEKLYPDYKIIITVRDIPWILDSLERLGKKNPNHKPVYASIYHASNIYTRCDEYMNNLIWNPYISLKEIINKNISNAMIVEYDALVYNPDIIMKSIYNHINEPYFEHDFFNITNIKDYEYFDSDININMPGLHSLRKQVYKEERNIIIPQDIIDK